jgi:hypothetical protein
VRKHKIRLLYERDALGITDDELIDDVGWSLWARCRSFLAANEAVQGRATCPVCEHIVSHTGNKEELLRCEECGWQLRWGDYFATIQHKQLSGAEPVLALFRDFAGRFPRAETAPEKMLLIDSLIHGFHWAQKYGPTRPVAVNLIEGRLADVIAFLDRLSYGEDSTAGIREKRDAWVRNSQTARQWAGLGKDDSLQPSNDDPAGNLEGQPK